MKLNNILLFILLILLGMVLIGCQPVQQTSGECPVGEPNCQDTLIEDRVELPVNPDFRTCPTEFEFVCKPVTQGYENPNEPTQTVCGCIQECPGDTFLVVSAGMGSWPDGSAKGILTCNKNLPPIPAIFPDDPQLLQICPDEWYDNQMPGIVEDSVNYPPSEYFILDGQRREMSEFDLDWVFQNCNLEVQVVV